MLKKLKDKLRNYFVAGLLTILPLSITAYVVVTFLKVMDRILNYLPPKLRPQTYIPIDFPGFGLILTFLIVLITGVLVKNYVGGKIITWGEYFVYKTPLIRTIYASVKQLIHAIVMQDNQSFKRVVVIEYPRKGIYSMAFVTGIPSENIQKELNQEEMINVFVPTTPNPTSGFYLMVPEKESFPLQISVEDAFKLIISGGIVSSDAPFHEKFVSGIQEEKSRKEEMQES
ncbi:MAG TPA: DUF502 domain-containing protein [Deltaproteobacteria bacterium]|nr:MAG: DUF502 domain-containing protein [Deltaproteobacteria bacterium]HDM79007.1 DUF502 domain-containing protein [Deltaproteobacteria bacterium]